MKITKKISSMFLCITLILSMVPLTIGTVSAEEAYNHTDHSSWQALTSVPISFSGTINYRLENDIALSQTLEIPNGSNVALCLNGKKLTTASSFKGTSIIKVDKGATFTLCDCQKSGTVSPHDNYKNAISGVFNDGTFNMNNCTIKDCSQGVINNTGIFNLYGGTIANNSYKIGFGAGITNYGTVNMYDGVIKENSAIIGGGIINVPLNELKAMKFTECNTTFNMFGGSIENNKAEISNNMTVTDLINVLKTAGVYDIIENVMSEGDDDIMQTVVENVSTLSGGVGAGVANLIAEFNMSGDAAITGNKISGAFGIGAGLFNGLGTVTMKDNSKIDENNLKTNISVGAGVFSYGSVTMDGGSISKNVIESGDAVNILSGVTIKNALTLFNVGIGAGVCSGIETIKRIAEANIKTVIDNSIIKGIIGKFVDITEIDGMMTTVNEAEGKLLDIFGKSSKDLKFVVNGGTISNNTITKNSTLRVVYGGVGAGICADSNFAANANKITKNLDGNTAKVEGNKIYIKYNNLFKKDREVDSNIEFDTSALITVSKNVDDNTIMTNTKLRDRIAILYKAVSTVKRVSNMKKSTVEKIKAIILNSNIRTQDAGRRIKAIIRGRK